MKYKDILTKEFLIKEYVDKRRTCLDISKDIGCARKTIGNQLVYHGIKARKSQKGLNKGKKHYNFGVNKYKITKQFLIKEYIKNKKSMPTIAKMVGCRTNMIEFYLIKNNIPRRTRSEALQGKNSSAYVDGRCSKQYYCKETGCDNTLTYAAWKRGSRYCKSCARKKLWQKSEFRNKTIKAIFEVANLSPNNPEKLLIKLLNKILPKTYQFVGDGKMIINGFCPDFINTNGQKKIIELYGNYWHNLPELKKRDERRIKTYKKYGYETLIIWEKELKNLTKVKDKINCFNKL